jgi:hypothetical protein
MLQSSLRNLDHLCNSEYFTCVTTFNSINKRIKTFLNHYKSNTFQNSHIPSTYATKLPTSQNKTLRRHYYTYNRVACFPNNYINLEDVTLAANSTAQMLPDMNKWRYHRFHCHIWTWLYRSSWLQNSCPSVLPLYYYYKCRYKKFSIMLIYCTGSWTAC